MKKIDVLKVYAFAVEEVTYDNFQDIQKLMFDAGAISANAYPTQHLVRVSTLPEDQLSPEVFLKVLRDSGFSSARATTAEF